MSKNITVEFTTDQEAGIVYGALRRLKREGYTQAYHIGDDYAVVNVADSTDVDTVLSIFNRLCDIDNPGIHAFDGGII